MKPGDIVWAKLEGHQYWPAKIVTAEEAPSELECGKREYRVYFLGSHDFGAIKKANIVSYEEGFAQHSDNPRARPAAKFNLAKEEAKHPENIVLYAEDVSEEESPKPKKRRNIEPKSKNTKKKPEITSKEPDSTMSPEEIEKTKYHEKINSLRIELQKICLRDEIDKSQLPHAEKIIEEFEKIQVTFELLKKTCIGKLLKVIVRRGFDPDEHSIIPRCKRLLEKWISEMEAAKERATAEGTPK